MIVIFEATLFRQPGGSFQECVPFLPGADEGDLGFIRLFRTDAVGVTCYRNQRCSGDFHRCFLLLRSQRSTVVVRCSFRILPGGPFSGCFCSGDCFRNSHHRIFFHGILQHFHRRSRFRSGSLGCQNRHHHIQRTQHQHKAGRHRDQPFPGNRSGFSLTKGVRFRDQIIRQQIQGIMNVLGIHTAYPSLLRYSFKPCRVRWSKLLHLLSVMPQLTATSRMESR